MCRRVIGLRHVELMDQPSCPGGLLGKLWVIATSPISAHALTECQSSQGSLAALSGELFQDRQALGYIRKGGNLCCPGAGPFLP
jgi:hypothetical protein